MMLKMRDRKVLNFVVVFAGVVCLAGRSAAVMCYDCTSTDSGTCSYPFNETDIPTVICNQCLTYRVVTTEYLSSSGVYIQGCNTLGYNRADSSCDWFGNKPACKGVCFTEYYNGQPGLVTSSTTTKDSDISKRAFNSYVNRTTVYSDISSGAPGLSPYLNVLFAAIPVALCILSCIIRNMCQGHTVNRRMSNSRPSVRAAELSQGTIGTNFSLCNSATNAYPQHLEEVVHTNPCGINSSISTLSDNPESSESSSNSIYVITVHRAYTHDPSTDNPPEYAEIFVDSRSDAELPSYSDFKST